MVHRPELKTASRVEGGQRAPSQQARSALAGVGLVSTQHKPNGGAAGMIHRRAVAKRDAQDENCVTTEGAASLVPNGMHIAEHVGDASSWLCAAGVPAPTSTRRADHAAGRRCAELAVQLSGAAGDIGQDDRGVPTWPATLVGSITHCPGYQLAVVGSSRDFLGIGVDAEPNQPVADSLLEVLATEREWKAARECPALDPPVQFARLMFVCKEALFKAWFPLHREELTFLDAGVRYFPNRSFQGVVHSSPARTALLEGRWAVHENPGGEQRLIACAWIRA